MRRLHIGLRSGVVCRSGLFEEEPQMRLEPLYVFALGVDHV